MQAYSGVFFGYRDGKEEGKGDQGCSKMVVRYRMGNRMVTIFAAPTPPLAILWVQVVI